MSSIARQDVTITQTFVLKHMPSGRLRKNHNSAKHLFLVLTLCYGFRCFSRHTKHNRKNNQSEKKEITTTITTLQKLSASDTDTVSHHSHSCTWVHSKKEHIIGTPYKWERLSFNGSWESCKCKSGTGSRRHKWNRSCRNEEWGLRDRVAYTIIASIRRRGFAIAAAWISSKNSCWWSKNVRGYNRISVHSLSNKRFSSEVTMKAAPATQWSSM